MQWTESGGLRTWNHLTICNSTLSTRQNRKILQKNIAEEYVKESGQNYVYLTKTRIIDVASLMRMCEKPKSAVSIAKTEITGDVTWVDRKQEEWRLKQM